METRRQWAAVPLNYGAISLCTTQDFVTAASELLAEEQSIRRMAVAAARYFSLS